MEQDRQLRARAVKAADQEHLTFTPAGLVHWLVVNVAAGVAVSNGQREEAAWLRELPIPSIASSPAGATAVLARVRDEAGRVLVRTWNETNTIRRLEPSLGRDRPGWLDATVAGAVGSRLWVGAAREAAHIARESHRTAAVRDRREELHGHPLDEGGWLETWLCSVEMDLWNHARETTLWPFAVEGNELDSGLILGGDPRYWPDLDTDYELATA